MRDKTRADYTTWDNQAAMDADCQTVREVKNYTGFSQLTATIQGERVRDMVSQITSYLDDDNYAGGVILEWKGVVPDIDVLTSAIDGLRTTAAGKTPPKHFDVKLF